jgi:hypothetical protein
LALVSILHWRGQIGFEVGANGDGPPGIAESSGVDSDVVGDELGVILARGQVIHHSFVVSNQSNTPLRILSVQPLTPCCSSVGGLPESVPAGGRVEIPVRFLPGTQSGQKRVEFLIRTDRANRPFERLALSATLVSEVELVALPESDGDLLIGRPGRQRIRVLCRRRGEEGRSAPASMTVPPSASARFVGPPAESVGPGGFMEAVREIEVELPAENTVGPRQFEISLHWADGQERPHVVRWVVRPAIKAAPEGLVLEASDHEQVRDVLLLSEGRPFRITGVSGQSLAVEVRATPSPSQSQRVHLVLNPKSRGAGGLEDLRITTDHPDQPTVLVSVLVRKSLGEAAR